MSVEMHQQSNDYTDDYSQNQEYDDQKQQQQQTVKEEQCNDSYVEEGDEEEGDGDNDGNEEGNDEGNDGDNGNDDDSQNQKSNNDQDYGPKCVRLRGLPWSATHKEILDFLKDVNVINGQKGIHLVTSRWDGKNTGEAYVEVQSESDVEEALKLNKGMMGHRYIEVFTATPKEAQAALKKTSGPVQSFVVKLRGLPYSVTEQQIEEFFNGLEIKADREGILFVMDKRGRATGEAYVQFESQEDTEQALGRNREKIGHRYIEIFRSSLAEMRRSTNGNGRPGPYDLKDRGSNRGDFGMGRNIRDWTSGGGGGGFGVGANNTLGFSNLSNYNNTGNFGNSFGNTGNFGNNSGSGGFSGGGAGAGFGNSRFNGPNYSGGGNFSSDFGDFGNFGNNRNNFNNGPKDFSDDSDFGVRSNSNSNFSTGGNYGSMTNFGNFGNNNNSGGNMGGGGSFSNMGGGSNFGPIGGGRNDCEYYTIHMRGLPYSCYENDVFKFFDPIRPANVRINFNKRGLHSGTSDVYFDTYEDAQLAMKRHKNQMGNRYIELFFDGKVKVGNNGNVLSNFSRRI